MGDWPTRFEGPWQDVTRQFWTRVTLCYISNPMAPWTTVQPATMIGFKQIEFFDHTTITLLKDSPNKENAIKFLQLLLGAAGTRSLNENGPAPIAPALVSAADLDHLPEALRPLVRASAK